MNSNQTKEPTVKAPSSSLSRQPRPLQANCCPPRRQTPPMLIFSPLAWLKLQFFLHAGETEIGGFAVSSDDDPLYIEDFVTVLQKTSCVTIDFDDEAVADYFDQQVDAGRTPSQFALIWIHTHPGNSAQPSGVDETTFARVFGRCDWSVMFIIARSGETYARMQFAAGPGAAMMLPVVVDWPMWQQDVVDRAAQLEDLLEGWMDEYGQNICPISEPFDTLDNPVRVPISGGHVPANSRIPVRATVPADREMIPAWDGEWWETDAEMAALAQMEVEYDEERRVRA